MAKNKTKTEYKLVYAARNPDGLDVDKTRKAFEKLKEKGWSSYKRTEWKDKDSDTTLDVIILGREQQVLTAREIVAMIQDIKDMGSAGEDELYKLLDLEFMMIGNK